MIDKLKQIFKTKKREKRSSNELKIMEKRNKKQNDSLTQMLAEYCRQYPQI